VSVINYTILLLYYHSYFACMCVCVVDDPDGGHKRFSIIASIWSTVIPVYFYLGLCSVVSNDTASGRRLCFYPSLAKKNYKERWCHRRPWRKKLLDVRIQIISPKYSRSFFFCLKSFTKIRLYIFSNCANTQRDETKEINAYAQRQFLNTIFFVK